MTILRPLVLATLMLLASVGATMLKPTQRMADSKDRIILEKAIPTHFGGWSVDPTVAPITVSPDVQARLDAIYNQTLSRTYVNGQGQRIMLSIAYGSDQGGDGTQVHRPEFCYAAQGFSLTSNAIGSLLTDYGQLAVRRLVAVQGQRNEPITYWITVGDRATLPGIGRKLSQIAYGLTGKVPDGMLVRVSSIDPREEHAYQLQDSFVKDMLAATSPADRIRIAGKFGA